MAPLSAHDVARELRHRLPDAGDVKIHKLLYYCQGWHLAWTNRPMFREAVVAWSNGPVVEDLWHAEGKGYGTPGAGELDNEMLTTIDYVVGRYGRLSGRELITLTHAEQPWQVATAEASGASPEITHDTLIAYFRSDPEQVSLRKLAHEVNERHDLRRVIEATSQPRSGQVEDETDELTNLLAGL